MIRGSSRFICLATLLFCGVAAADDLPAVRKDLKIENLGSPVKRRELGKTMVYRQLRTGDLHLFTALSGANGLEEPDDAEFQVLDLDLKSGTFRTTMGPKGFAGRMWFHANGKIYLGVGRPELLTEYDPATAKLRVLGSISENYFGGIQCFSENPDGLLLLGTYRRFAGTYNPKTGELKRYGPLGGKGNEWVYNIAGDARYIYAHVFGHGKNKLYVIDLKTDAIKEYDGGAAFRATDGKVYSGSWRNPSHVWVDGQPEKIAKRIQVKPVTMTGEIYFLNQAERELGLVFDTSEMDPNQWNHGSVTVRWRFKSEEEKAFDAKAAKERDAAKKEDKLGAFDARVAEERRKFETGWRSASFEGVDIVENAVRTLAPMPDGKLLGYGAHYGPLFVFDPATHKANYLGMAPCSIYDILVTKDHVFFSGYSSVFAVYDRSKPYEFSKADAPPFYAGNPWRMPAAKWTTDIVRGADGRIYAGGHYGRHTTGSEIVIFDPTKGKREYDERIREPLLHYAVRRLCAANGGKLIVAACYGLPNTKADNRAKADADGDEDAGNADEAKGFAYLIYDTETRKLRWLNAAPDQVYPRNIMGGLENEVVGVENGKLTDAKGEAVAGTRVMRVNLVDGKVVYDKTLAGAAFTGPREWDYNPDERKFGLDAHGGGWFFIDKWLTRLHPDGTVEKVMEMPHGARMVFVGDDIYLYNGGRQFYRGFCGIWRIRNVFAKDAAPAAKEDR